jgi:hypothetical protein
MSATKRPPRAAGFREVIGDLAEGAMRGRSRVERSEIVGKVLEALVLDVLASDDRFVGRYRGLYWELRSGFEERELARRRKEERDAEASSAGESYAPAEPAFAIPGVDGGSGEAPVILTGHGRGAYRPSSDEDDAA